jgi:hypothetical protein
MKYPRPASMIWMAKPILGAFAAVALCISAQGQDRSPVLKTITPTWLDTITHPQLPSWYDGSRVTMHAEFASSSKHPVFVGWSELARDMGLSHVVQAIKREGEGAWWPTAVGQSLPSVSKGGNLAKDLIDGAHRNGVRLIAYHRHMEDAWAAAEHPDWRAVDHKGGSYLGRNDQVKMSFSSPYADFMLTRIEELTRLGLDGFYFDEAHSMISWDPYTKAAFEKETGLQYPTALNPEDPAFQAAAVYNQIVIERFFAAARSRIKAINPDCVLLISIRGYDGWASAPERAENVFLAGERLSRIADSSKTELSHGHRRWPQPYSAFPSYADKEMNVLAGYLIARDAAQGRPAHVWFAGVIHTALVYEYLTAAVIGSGNIANLSGVSGSEMWENRGAGCLYENAIRLGNKVSPAMAGTDPMRWAAIHLSDRSRDAFQLEGGEERVEACVGAAMRTYFHVLQKEHLPASFITDSQLEEGVWPDTRVLCLPETDHLTPQMKKSIEAFQQRGGTVVNIPGEQRDVGDFKKASEAFRAALLPVAKAAPIVAEVDAQKAHIAAYTKKGSDTWVVNAWNAFMWWPFINERKKGPAGEAALKVQNTAPSPVKGMVVKLSHPEGKKPKAIKETVSGRLLEAEPDGSSWKIAVPDYTSMAQLVIEF